MTGENYAEFRRFAGKDGVALLLFPCGQFGEQEFSTAAQIKDFVREEGLGYRPNVHIMQKDEVIGDNAHPAWQLFYSEAIEAGALIIEPSWNFEGKFVISKTGEIRKVPFMFGNVEDIIDEFLAE